VPGRDVPVRAGGRLGFPGSAAELPASPAVVPDGGTSRRCGCRPEREALTGRAPAGWRCWSAPPQASSPVAPAARDSGTALRAGSRRSMVTVTRRSTATSTGGDGRRRKAAAANPTEAATPARRRRVRAWTAGGRITEHPRSVGRSRPSRPIRGPDGSEPVQRTWSGRPRPPGPSTSAGRENVSVPHHP
jgi:hypothetical protein